MLRASKELSEIQGKALRDLVFEFKDIWRVRLSADGPAKVTPIKVHLKPDAFPCRTKAIWYAPKRLDFMRKQIKSLEEMGCIRRNTDSRRSSPVLIVAKPKLPDEVRMTGMRDIPSLIWSRSRGFTHP